MKKILIIGRTWKFVEFLIPTLSTIYKNHNRSDYDIIVLENKSSRTKIISDYCLNLLDNGVIDGYYLTDKNYYSFIWNSLKDFIDIFDKYEFISLTDLDMSLETKHDNWLFKLTNVLEKNTTVGAVSVDFLPMLPNSEGFTHVDLNSSPTFPDFWEIPTDGWFYTTRSSELIDFVKSDGIGPGMHGYNSFIQSKGKKIGRTNLQFFHYGWLRTNDEFKNAYNETGIQFSLGSRFEDNPNFMRLQETKFNEMNIISKYLNLK